MWSPKVKQNCQLCFFREKEFWNLDHQEPTSATIVGNCHRQPASVTPIGNRQKTTLIGHGRHQQLPPKQPPPSVTTHGNRHRKPSSSATVSNCNRRHRQTSWSASATRNRHRKLPSGTGIGNVHQELLSETSIENCHQKRPSGMSSEKFGPFCLYFLQLYDLNNFYHFGFGHETFLLGFAGFKHNTTTRL